MTGEQDELDGLPTIRWSAHLSPTMDRREQLLRYQDSVGAAATRRQVELRRQELAAEKAAPKAPGRR